MKFKNVALVFEQIEQISGRLEIIQLLADLFSHTSSTEIAILSYISLGELHAPYRGSHINMAEKNALKAVAQLTGDDLEHVTKKVKKEGDIGAVIMQYDWKTDHDLNVTQVYNYLHSLEETTGAGSQEKKINMLVELLQKLDPLSAKYVIRIIVGKLRLGFSDMTLIDAFSWMAVGDKSAKKIIEQAYNVCADIGYIAYQLKEKGLDTLKKPHIKIGVPIRPAAAERMNDAQEIIDKIGSCVAQPKLDGFRLQMHIDNTHKEPLIKIFSRNLLDMTHMFPELVEQLKTLPVDTLIVEGEAIGIDTEGEFLLFQETVKRKRKHKIEEVSENIPLHVYLFDILYYNGNSLLEEPHTQRREMLETLFKKKKYEMVQVIEEKKITHPDQIDDYFDQMMDMGLEGLIIRRSDAPYQAGKRNFNWIKLKSRETDEVEDTIDVVILGYYRGSGRRASFGIGAFLAGIYNKKRDCFQTIARVGSGLSDEGWKELKKTCDRIVQPEQPNNVECHKNLIPDVWVIPQIVCTVRADQITESPLHTAAHTEDKGGYALRFPRFITYRADKSEFDATTADEIVKMYKDQKKI